VCSHIFRIIVFSLAGAIIYNYTGANYVTAPAVGSLQPLYKKVAFSFMVPTIIFLGILYASVSARFVFFRIFHDSKHKGNHTVLGWGTWIGILFVLWVFAFLVAELIPCMRFIRLYNTSSFHQVLGSISANRLSFSLFGSPIPHE